MPYTPGPWTADGCVIETDNGYDIAVTAKDIVWTPSDDMDERLANARLIEAAPDFFAAAEEALTYISDDVMQVEAGTRFMVMLAAAYAKARGGA